VVEGCGSNGVEYMTGGVAVILGSVGENFAAGMTGGMAFVHDPRAELPIKLNEDSVVATRLKSSYWEQLLLGLIEEHAAETGSRHAKRLLQQWDVERTHIWQICPKEMVTRLKHPLADEPAAARA
jgi:glutamate synthase (NADPH/NADH) large chain